MGPLTLKERKRSVIGHADYVRDAFFFESLDDLL